MQTDTRGVTAHVYFKTQTCVLLATPIYSKCGKTWPQGKAGVGNSGPFGGRGGKGANPENCSKRGNRSAGDMGA